MKLTTAQIEVLVALHKLAPVSVGALGIYFGHEPHAPLRQLCDAGLVQRYKWQPPKLTREQALHARSRVGKRPYLYELAPGAAAAAEHLATAFDLLNGQENDA